MRLCGQSRAQWPCKRQIGSSMTHGDANENGDVLVCTAPPPLRSMGKRPTRSGFWELGSSGSRDSGGINGEFRYVSSYQSTRQFARYYVCRALPKEMP